jgi:protein-tyrosine phosphatase
MTVISVSGTFNLRDLGGLPVRGGGETRARQLFRSGGIAELTEDGAEQLRSLGLHTIVDLREPIEDNTLPPVLDDLAPAHRANPIYRREFDIRRYDGLGALYADVLDRAGDRLAGAIAILAGPGALPALVHCSAGKDRTGLVVGLLLSALGVPTDAVAADYALSERYFVGEARERALARAAAAGMGAQRFAVISHSPPELMFDVLGRVQRSHGSAEAYLLAHGLSAEALDRLRADLVG